MRRRVVLGVLLAALLAAAPAHAAVTQDQAVRIAAGNPQIHAEIVRVGPVTGQAQRTVDGWQVLFERKDRVRAEALVDPLTGRITEAYVGTKAEFPLARGAGSGVAQRKLNAIWIWIPLTLIFVLAFFDPRRPWRLLHLDLLMVAAFGLSYAFFMTGRLTASVPLSYPPLVYLLARSLHAGLRPRVRSGPVTRLSPRIVLGLALGLIVFRIGLALADPFVIDVGYASSAGAQRILDGLQLYTRGGNHFDTYGPLAYLAYIPFVKLWAFSQLQEAPGSAQAAAIFFDLVTVAGLAVLGRRLRLGATLVLAWAACPFTALSLVCSSNDAMVPAFLVWAFVFFRSGWAVGLLTGAAAAAKFTPAFLLPLFARGSRGRALAVIATAVAVMVVTLLPLLPGGGVREFYDTTIGFQLHRYSPFSFWSQHPSLHFLQTLLKLAALALAVGVAFVRTHNRGQVAALATAVLVAEQLPLQHWFYLYLVWVVPLYCLALFTEHEAGARPAA